MESIHFRRYFSRNVLFRMIVLSMAAAGILTWKLDFINDVYFRDQLTSTGFIINGTIVVLFTLGLLRIIWILLSYDQEERALQRFVENLEDNIDPLMDIGDQRMISRRYRTMKNLHLANTPINHNALASTLVAAESTRNSLPKFINNILILSGVFGTIVALSIALIGASDLLASAVNVNGMGLVVHGMSTALSTTITAIVCYLFYGYFYLKLTDAQTNLLSAVEQVSATYLAPRFQVEPETTLYEFTGLVRSLQNLVTRMEKSHKLIMKVETQLLKAVDQYQERSEKTDLDMVTIIELLRKGFRLRDGE